MTTRWDVDEDRLRDLIRSDGSGDVLAALVATKNPDYEIHTFDTVAPFKVAVDTEGQVVRVFFRERNVITEAVFSRSLGLELRAALNAILDEEAADLAARADELDVEAARWEAGGGPRQLKWAARNREIAASWRRLAGVRPDTGDNG